MMSKSTLPEEAHPATPSGRAANKAAAGKRTDSDESTAAPIASRSEAAATSGKSRTVAIAGAPPGTPRSVKRAAAGPGESWGAAGGERTERGGQQPARLARPPRSREPGRPAADLPWRSARE